MLIVIVSTKFTNFFLVLKYSLLSLFPLLSLHLALRYVNTSKGRKAPFHKRNHCFPNFQVCSEIHVIVLSKNQTTRFQLAHVLGGR